MRGATPHEGACEDAARWLFFNNLLEFEPPYQPFKLLPQFVQVLG